MGSLFPPLNLEPDADERAVKRAYAALLKITRPDDDPAAFQALVGTRDAALEWVRRRPQWALSNEPDVGDDPDDADRDHGEEPVAAVFADHGRGHADEPVVAGVLIEALPEADPAAPDLQQLGSVEDRVAPVVTAEPAQSGHLVDRIGDRPADGAQPDAAPTDKQAREPIVRSLQHADADVDLLPTAPSRRVEPVPPPVDTLSVRLLARDLIEQAQRLIAGRSAVQTDAWQQLLGRADELDLGGRVTFERAVAIDLNAAMQLRKELDPAHSADVAAVVVLVDRAFGWSNDMRHLVRILGDTGVLHPLVFAVERFGTRAPRLTWTETGFPVVPQGDLEAWFGKADHPGIASYRSARQSGSFGFGWSWLAFLCPGGWAFHERRPLVGLALVLSATLANAVMFDPIANVYTANAFVCFLVLLLTFRVALALSARPLGFARMAKVIARIDASQPPTTAERRRLIAAQRAGSWIGVGLAGFLFLANDSAAIEIVLRGLNLDGELVTRLIGPADRTDQSATFAERLVAASFLQKATHLKASADKLLDTEAAASPLKRKHIEHLQAEVREAVSKTPIDEFQLRFQDLDRRMSALKPN